MSQTNKYDGVTNNQYHTGETGAAGVILAFMPIKTLEAK
jgi:hypothetical protein